MNHLTPDELIDAVEETLTAARRAHLTECPRCGVEVAQLAAVLQESRVVEGVPEPSPLFWDQLSNRVRTAVAAESNAAPRFAHWFQWPVLVPFVGLALLVFALGSALSPEAFTVPPVQVAVNGAEAIDAMTVSGLDENWAVVSELVGDLDIDTAREAGIAVEPGSAEGMAMHLSSVEQQELVRLLQAELRGGTGG